jgi:iron complex transport system substrate-binding protein
VETIIASHPDYIFVSASKHGGFDVLRDCGIPLVPHHGYKETDPLGQAEWIKLIGLLTGEPRRANAVFADIERKYTTLREEVANIDVKCKMENGEKVMTDLPTVASGRQLRDGWYIVGGRSYMAQLFRDAGARYIMADNEDSGGTTLEFEAAYARSLDADFWQTDGSYAGDFTMETLAAEDARYTTMKAFRNNNVIFCNLSQTPYRELAGVQPHLLLADFVKAFHPELLPHYTPHYYKLLK